MSAQFTTLSSLIARMQRWQFTNKTEEQYLVRDLDEAIRKVRRHTQLPWTIKRTTLRVFSGVFEYPLASDHDELIYLDNDNAESYENRKRAVYTSPQEFYDDPDNRNDLAEIWDNGSRFLAARYNITGGSALIDNAETASRYTVSGDASAITLDNVVFSEGNGSIRFTVTLSSGVATITVSPTSLSDSNYKRKYYFRKVYLAAVPTSITLRYGNDSSNYITSTVTTQFSGQAFKANAWNLVAMDLSTTPIGTIDSSAFDYETFALNGAASGTYYLDAGYVRAWELLDYWYYSTYNIATVGQTSANQEFFYNSSEAYSTDSQLIGDKEWADVIMYDALIITAGDNENKVVKDQIADMRNDSWDTLLTNYPSMRPLITTRKWRFQHDQ